jgi:AAA+ superfamily predicted ATPase/ribosomal protein S25
MNISKRGISTSVGVRGASVTFGKNGTYLNTGIPGTGFYNRQRIGGGSIPRTNNRVSVTTPKVSSKGTYTFTGVMCIIVGIICLAAGPIGLVGTVIFFMGAWGNFANRKKYYGKNVEAAPENSPSYISAAKEALEASTDERQKRILQNFIDTVETVDAIEDEEQILETLNKKPAKNAELISTHTAELTELRRKLAATEYDVDAPLSTEVLSRYEEMCQAFEKLLTSQKIWFQESKVQNNVAKSSAASLVSLKETAFEVGVFNYIKSKFDVPIIPMDNKLLYLYPEFAVLAQSPSQFEVVDYKDISITYSPIRFHEPGSYPSDAEKIGTTWQYVNKNGGPDKRFSYNPQIAVVRYGGIYVTIKNHFSGTFQISNADLAEKFCAGFNAHLCGLKGTTAEDLKPEPTLANEDQSTLADVILAADKLYQCMVDMSCDKQVLEALDNQHQLDAVRDVDMGGGKVNNRLAAVVATDLIKCFEGLGHKADMSTDEGRAIGLLLSRLVVSDNAVWNNEMLMRQPEGSAVLKNAYDLFKKNIHVQFDPERFLLIELLRHEGVDEETVNRWAVLLYRYAMMIAKVDGYLSDTEQKWLSNILSFTKNGSVNTTKYKTTTKQVALPKDVDALFAEVARYVVSSNVASTSEIQRRYGIGYSRAGRIMDQLEQAGVVGPANGGKPRAIIMSADELDNLLNNGSATVESIEEVTTNEETPEQTKPTRKVNSKVITNPMTELENLIGLESVKTEINNIYNLVKVQKVRASKGLSAPDISYHCVFTGNPGTGKTTVARLVAQIYKQLGILSKGHLVETDRSGLVAEYVGQTAVKTNKIIDSALDGVLFIDEAYSLVQDGGGNDFGLEAIATLLKRMEDNRDRLVVILAGYSEEMKKFIDSNPGLQSRFNRYIHFDDYSADELTSIYKFYLAKYDYRMTAEAEAAVKELMDQVVANKDKNFGNARFVRNLFEKTLERQAKRLAASSLSNLSEEALVEITEQDVVETR